MKSFRTVLFLSLPILSLFFLSACQMPSTPTLDLPSVSSGPSVSSETQNTRWEYKILTYMSSPTGAPGLSSEEECKVNINPLQPEGQPFCIVEDGNPALLEQMNKLGQDGWELVSVSSPYTFVLIFTFKRPIP